MIVLQTLQHMILACVITLGWCLMFAMPKRYIITCLGMTALAFVIKTLLLAWHLHLMIATFFAAMIASFVGVYFSQKHSLTPKALIVPSIIFLMPGIAAYKAMVSMVQIGYFGFSVPLFTAMMHNFFVAIFTISALVLGLSIPGLLFYRRRPIV